jgi:hypothetical protein
LRGERNPSDRRHTTGKGEEVTVENIVNFCEHDVPESATRFVAKFGLLTRGCGLRRPEDPCAIVVDREVDVGGREHDSVHNVPRDDSIRHEETP